MSNPAHDGDLLRSGWQARARGKENVGARDKMQPSLLDRLTDNDPEKVQEPANSNLITHAALRRHVLRDLQWLFNTINNDAQRDLSGFAARAPLGGQLRRGAAGGQADVGHRMARYSAQADRGHYPF